MGSKVSLFLAELKRRKVYRVAAVYAAVGVAICLGVPDLFSAFDLPTSVARLVIVLIALGFPIALVLAWAFEVRPEGTPQVEEAVAGQASLEVTGKEVGREGPVPESAVFALPKGPAIAVLPFTNMSGNPDDEFFTDGMTGDIITGLARFTRLFVIARNSTFRFKGRG